MPESPGMQVHAGLGEERGGVEVVGKIGGDLPHGVVIVLGGFLQIGIRIGGKALRHRLNVGLLAGRGSGRQIDRFLHRVMRVLETVRVGGIVVVRSDRLGDAPVGHRQLGIEFGGMLKRARGLVVIEAIDEAQSLIEELLRLRIVRGDRVMKIAQSGDQRDGMSLGMSVSSMILRRRAQAQQTHRTAPAPEFSSGQTS